MDALRFRPRVEPAEDRLAPSANPAAVFAAAFQVPLDTAALEGYATGFGTDAGLRGAVVAADQTADTLVHFVTALQTQVGFVDVPLGIVYGPLASQFVRASVQAQTNVAFGVGLAAAFGVPLPPLAPPRAPDLPSGGLPDVLGPEGPPPNITFPVIPPTVPPTTPGNVPADSGLTDIVPEVSVPPFQDIGTGVLINDVVVGTGETALDGDTVQVFYNGYLADDGTLFDQRRSPNPPAQFVLASGAVIDGFRQGIVGMKPGGIREIFIPSDLAYGPGGNPGAGIPGDADLVFEVKLIATT